MTYSDIIFDREKEGEGRADSTYLSPRLVVQRRVTSYIVSDRHLNTHKSSNSVKRGLRVFCPQNLGKDAQKNEGCVSTVKPSSSLSSLFGMHHVSA